jgi:hypothetical protein
MRILNRPGRNHAFLCSTSKPARHPQNSDAVVGLWHHPAGMDAKCHAVASLLIFHFFPVSIKANARGPDLQWVQLMA